MPTTALPPEETDSTLDQLGGSPGAHNDPLTSMGYDPRTTPAERSLEIEEEEKEEKSPNGLHHDIKTIRNSIDYEQKLAAERAQRRDEKNAPQPAQKPPAPTTGTSNTNPTVSTNIQQPTAAKPPVTPPPVNAPSAGGKSNLAGNALSSFKNGKAKFGQTIGRARNAGNALNAAQDIKENSKEYAKEYAKEQAKEYAKKVAKEAAKKAAQAAKQAAAEATEAIGEFLVATAEIWVPVLAVILIIVVVIGLIILLFTLSGKQGSGPPQYPTTTVQKSQAGLAAALAGNKPQQFKVVESVVASEETRYNTIEAEAKADSSTSGSLAGITQVQNMLKQVDQAAKSSNVAQTSTLLTQTIAEEKTIESALPFGAWITKLAEADAQAGTQTSCFIAVTGVTNAKVGCASFVSVDLEKAGVPQSPVGSTLAIWQNPQLTQVVGPVANHGLDSNLAQSSLSQLKPGDVVWWGNGIDKKTGGLVYSGALFNHVGIFVGTDNSSAGAKCSPQCVVNNSSGKEQIVESSLSRTDIIFNGAKRYAP